MNSDEILKCYEESFITESNSEPDWQIDDNKILSEMREEYLKTNVVFWPSITINSMLYKGNLEPL